MLHGGDFHPLAPLHPLLDKIDSRGVVGVEGGSVVESVHFVVD